MLIVAIVLSLGLGLAARGDMLNLARIRLRWVAAIFVALVIRFATEAAIGAGVGLVNDLRLPLYATAYVLLLAALWVNRAQPGLSLAFVGILANTVAILLNGGYMPIWQPSLVAAGFSPADVSPVGFHVLVTSTEFETAFLSQAVVLGDLIPIPVPFVTNVISLGDLFLSAGVAFFLFATVVRAPADLFEDEAASVRRRLAEVAVGGRDRGVRTETGLRSGLLEASGLSRPLLLGGAGAGLAGPAALPSAPGIAQPVVPAIPALLERARHHPYVRLALNPSFSALWAGQLVSLLGDRIHQIALAFLVLGATNSAIALGAVFVAATLPNLLFGPIAGTLVDRWDEREVLIVSDLLRATIVILIPIAAIIQIWLVYPLVFLMTTVSIFFRPARISVLPRIVERDDLIVANSAMWIGESFADIGGYALAGLFVAFLGASLPVAFWFDGVSYVASAVLIATIVVRPRSAPVDDGEPQVRSIVGEMRDGWRFLRHETVLLGNTFQGVAGQAMIGVLLALMPIFARDAIEGTTLEPEKVLAFLESGIGLGNLIGGFAVGLIGARIRLGRMVILGYALTGALVAVFGLTGDLGLALGLIFGVGAGNLVFVIPSQTLFQQRTPPELMGRVIGFRFALVFGGMTIAAAAAGVLGHLFGPGPVIVLFGLTTVAAGLAGLLVPTIRDA
ncbi:MAG: MFS transporter [Chloroflexota bacterium]